MKCLAISQMNMMQVVLQKVAYRSKDIQKKERFVGAKLNRKQIFLEGKNFDLMKVLRQSLDIAEERNEEKLAQKMKLTSRINRAPSTIATKASEEIK